MKELAAYLAISGGTGKVTTPFAAHSAPRANVTANPSCFTF
jgi:hypothetical protein